MMRIVKCVWILAACFLAACAFQAGAASTSGQSPVYVDASFSNQIRVEEDRVVLEGLYSSPDGHERSWFELESCSTDQYICQWIAGTPFAVPTNSFKKDAAFAHVGGRFAVEACFREVDGACVIALFKVECPFATINRQCVVETGSAKARPAGTAYYFYNRAYGVTAFGFERDSAKTDGDSIGHSFILQGKCGFLSTSCLTK